MQRNCERVWLVTLIDGRVRQYVCYTPLDARRQAWRTYGRGSVIRIERYA